MKLVASTDPVLLGIAKPVVFPAASLSRTTSEMLQLMIAQNGCGLAAPQVGLGLRLFTFRVGAAMGVIVNPTIIERSPEEIEAKEGCLTFPNRDFLTKRSRWVKVTYQDLLGKSAAPRLLDGFMAIVFQHETDHLDGRLVSQHGVEVIAAESPTTEVRDDSR